ncbi:MAG: S8/S53 family peptidase [bacterium]|nr:S8/S53 family peptidase [bacterium]
MQPKLLTPLLLLAAASWSLASPSQTNAVSAEPAPERIVYSWKKTITADGRVIEEAPITDLMDWLDSGAGTIDLNTLEDSEGRQYQLVAGAWQASEDGDVHYEMQLVQARKRKLSEAEIEREWLAENPGASAAEIATFRQRKELREDPVLVQPRVSPEVEAWISAAPRGERLRTTVRLREDAHPLRLPRIAPNLFTQEPAAALELMEQRLIAIETRKTELTQVQAPLIDELEAYGGELIDAHWIINGFDAELTWSALVALAANPAVEHIEVLEAGIYDDNDLEDMREAAQVVQLHDDGSDGESGSGGSYNDICLAIIDSDVDADHPAWDDWAGGSSRLQSIWRNSASTWSTVTTSATSTPSHGTKVAGVAVADLMQGQDSSITSTSSREARTGFAPEASFVFLEESGAGAVSAIEHAVTLSPDIINLSMSFGTGTLCNLSASSNEAVDAAMLDGIFFAKSGGNNGFSGSSCVVGNPGAASGAFTVNQLDRSAVPLKDADANGGASRGGDSLNRGVIAIAAFAGPEADTAAKVGDTYGAFGASSAATPVVAGTAACLKDHMLEIFSSSIANEVGFLYATMLMLADGQMEDGSFANTWDPMDEVYGAGRLRVRMFNSAGMDGPWRMRLFSRVIEDGELAADMLVNPNSSGVNQALSSDVERLRAACFWHEPNVENGSTWTADIRLSIQGSNGYTYYSGTDDDPRQRIYLGNAVGGHSWTLRLMGNDVPISWDSNYRFLDDERKVYVAVYWEDTDRDDADGPSEDID